MFEICFLIHSANLFLLIRKFKWFTFRVTTDKKGLTPAILLFFLYVLYLFFPLFPSLLSFLFNWFIVVYLLDFLISFTVYFYTFLVVIIGITINILSLQQYNLNWYQVSFNSVQKLCSYTASSTSFKLLLSQFCLSLHFLIALILEISHR